MVDFEISNGSQDFLLLNYDDADFFVNRNQFSGSTSLQDVKSIKSSLPYVNSIFEFNNENILLFDCNQYLKDNYGCEVSNKSCLCLLMQSDNFTAVNRPLVQKLLGKNPKFSQEYLGLIITSHSEISKVMIDEIFLSPSGIRPLLNKNGLYGCRFPEEGRIQYFIDLELMIINVLKGIHK